ncbi:MAG: copper transport protein [Thermoplasmata archaeon]|jgi:copper transport protein|nr:copper transport protein [Thermoplasmata archaeon]
MRRPAAWALPLLLAAVLAAPLAAGHATLVESHPGRGDRLAEAPDRAVVFFSEQADPGGSFVHVQDAATGERVDLGDLRYDADPPRLSVGLPDLPAGAYTMQWQALSGRDGHTTSGVVGFAIGSHEPPASSESSKDSARPLAVAARVFLYAGFSLAFGALAFLAWMPADARPLARKALAAGAGLHLLGVLVLARETALSSSLPVEAFLATGTGQILAFRAIVGAAALLVAVLAQLRPTRTAAPAVLLLLAAAGLASARLGHASSEGVAFIALDFLHLAAASAWTGGLVLYAWWLLRSPGPVPAGAGARFGALALTAVAILGGTGVVLAVAILGVELAASGAALSAAWGVFLALKILAFGLMLLAATVNRYVLLEPERAKGPVAALQRAARALSGGRLRAGLADGRRLGRSVAVEAGVGAVVLVLAALLTSVSPPTADAAAPGVTFEARGEHHLVRVAFDDAPRFGATGHATLTVTDEDGQPIQNDCGRPNCLAIELRYPDGGSERRSVPVENGTAYLHSVVWAAAGPAELVVTVSTQAHFEDVATVAFTIAP